MHEQKVEMKLKNVEFHATINRFVVQQDDWDQTFGHQRLTFLFSPRVHERLQNILEILNFTLIIANQGTIKVIYLFIWEKLQSEGVSDDVFGCWSVRNVCPSKNVWIHNELKINSWWVNNQASSWKCGHLLKAVKTSCSVWIENASLVTQFVQLTDRRGNAGRNTFSLIISLLWPNNWILFNALRKNVVAQVQLYCLPQMWGVEAGEENKTIVCHANKRYAVHRWLRLFILWHRGKTNKGCVKTASTLRANTGCCDVCGDEWMCAVDILDAQPLLLFIYFLSSCRLRCFECPPPLPPPTGLTCWAMTAKQIGFHCCSRWPLTTGLWVALQRGSVWGAFLVQ